MYILLSRKIEIKRGALWLQGGFGCTFN